MSDAATWVSAGAAVVSVGAAIWATRKAGKAHKDSVRIQTKLGNIEEARENDRQAAKKTAALRATVFQNPKERGLGYYKLRIANEGQAKARAIEVRVNNIPFDKHADAVGNPPKPETLGPGASCEYWIAASVKPPFVLGITWDDESGKPGRFTTTL